MGSQRHAEPRGGRSVTNEATLRQIEAARPDASTWLAANAGSGKTRVLTDRVARLLLSGVPPQNILCLTYTKAAASEMQNRLFSRLGDWAMKPDDTLTATLAELGVSDVIDEDRLARARRLFARAIETPGGLKIQTIHAFCAALLRQFPLEAGVSPQFSEMDERSLKLLCDEVMETLADGANAHLIDDLAVYLSTDDDIGTLATHLLKHREAFETPRTLPDLLAVHGLPREYDEAALMSEVFLGSEDMILAALHPALKAGSKTDVKAAVEVAGLLPFAPHLGALPKLEKLLLTGSGAKEPFTAKSGKFPTKATQQALDPKTFDQLDQLMLRIEEARPKRIALPSAQRSAALHAFARAFLPAIDARKSERGLLDFDDLILRAKGLMTDPRVADWVLFKLDGGIDHILVDEAQDTSPVQWQVIELLAREFTSGASARDDVNRTLFVVGDRKQSIYSFQGADPAKFEAMQGHFRARLEEVASTLATQQLLHSFRSSAAILDTVDATFAENAPGVGAPIQHRAFKDTLPGRVDLWPPEPPADKDDDQPWHEPVDKISPRHEIAVLADKVAGEIRRLIDTGETIPDGSGGRKLLTEGDILILVQRRGRLFSELIRACKQQHLDIAGADRLKLGQELAVKDLLALLNFLALPEDDLSLAAVLKSPLFNWTEDQLYRLAQPRKGYLWHALRDAEGHEETRRTLDELRHDADLLRPYDLLDRVLTRYQGREKLIARLGSDCEEAIDALLTEALTYEQSEIPSLTGFLVWITSEDVEVKRQAESGGEKLRIMTVHGSKGLEAPVVILPDCGKRRASSAPAVLTTPDGLPLWTPPADATPDIVADAKADWQARQAEERERLLYVAMTRAEVWLIVCAAGDPDKMSDTWHERVAFGMKRLSSEPLPCPTGEGRRVSHGDWSACELIAVTAEDRETTAKPDWFAAPVPPHIATRADVLRPSDLGGAKALPGEAGEDEATAMLRGTRVHQLLELLPGYPQDRWPDFAPDLLRSTGDDAPPDDTMLADLLAEATAVLTQPDLQVAFGRGTLAEVEVTATLPGHAARMHGTIDRLIVADDHVLAIDFKTNRQIPDSAEDVPEGLLRQMGAYAAALADIYPDKRIDTAILWTANATLMPLPHELVSGALHRVSSPALDDHRT
ncbi:double-strand break repair helicase AddA [Qingshengfaniella alkalisoli]|uniref:DNA 3'-5' helicase n=1 Tax=Qingshengfaniella alkalisoli TaxID=2599296 RepID=A0A5B8J6K8_9RHOB|nr:double-strand break repair helicase AddA [Qingshengfaniella alkalisoli]QDY69970.1 double-strand break repair helicase AddA [Qingshengfaniella alkalisoli]